MINRVLLVLALAVLGAQPVLAHPEGQAAPAGQPSSAGQPSPAGQTSADDEILPPPATYKANDVKVAEQLGARVPVETRFRDQDGKLVRLGDVLAGELAPERDPAGILSGRGSLPTILTFNYSDCPMLCNLQLNGLSSVLPALAELVDNRAFAIGTQFRIVTIDLEPKDSLDKVIKMRERYVQRLPEARRAAARAGWTFLVAERPGDDSGIRKVAESVGFSYTYIPERAEWAHPAALIFLSVKGTVTRYVYGIEFEPQVMRDSIVKAGINEPATAVGFMNRCYHFDPDANNHSRAGVMALRIGAAGFVVLLLSALGVMHVIRRARSGVNRS